MTNFNSDGFDPAAVADEIESIMEEDFQEQKTFQRKRRWGGEKKDDDLAILCMLQLD